MVRRNSHVIRRENNVLEVDFSREPDPPAPRFPGASGLRELTEEGREAEWLSAEYCWTLAGRNRRLSGCRAPVDDHTAAEGQHFSQCGN